MAGEIFVTFGFLSAALAFIGAALMGASEVIDRVEEARNERNWKDWVDRYGESGRK